MWFIYFLIFTKKKKKMVTNMRERFLFVLAVYSTVRTTGSSSSCSKCVLAGMTTEVFMLDTTCMKMTRV